MVAVAEHFVNTFLTCRGDEAQRDSQRVPHAPPRSHIARSHGAILRVAYAAGSRDTVVSLGSTCTTMLAASNDFARMQLQVDACRRPGYLAMDWFVKPEACALTGTWAIVA